MSMPRKSAETSLPLSQIGTFCDEWRVSTLQEACELVTDGTHDSPKETKEGFPLVTGKCIKGGTLNVSAAYLISEEDHNNVISRSQALKGDLLFANIGNSIGEVCQIKEEVDISIKNLALFKPSERLDGTFLLAYLRSRKVQTFIKNTTLGSAQPFIGLGSLRAFPVPLPPPAEQKAIAHVLGTLDDKIELNQKINQTLEEIAKAIFKSWFVDFDPVRAKAGGRPTGLPPEISDLFPDGLVDSEIGEIPKGWEVKTIADLADCVGGATPSTKKTEFWEDGQHTWTSPKDLSDSKSIHLLKTDRKITEAGLRKISSGLLPVGTVLLSSRAPVGYLALTTEPTAINQGYIALKPRSGISNYFLLHWCESNLDEIKNRASGTTFEEISKAAFRPIPAIEPSNSTMEKFHHFVSPIYERVLVASKEMETLAELRDTLLPKLISGDLRIPDAEKFLEEAGI